MIDIANTNNHKIVTIVVSNMEVSNISDGEVLQVVSVSFLWLSHHMFSVNVEMGVFN